MLTYIKKLATYVSDLSATFLGFAHDSEASDLVLGEDLERICIQNEAAHEMMGQDEDMERAQMTLWLVVWNTVESFPE